MDAFTADHVLQMNLREHLRVFVALLRRHMNLNVVDGDTGVWVERPQ